MRVVNTRVLPLPAPAKISADWCGRVTAWRCSGLRPERRVEFIAQLSHRMDAGCWAEVDLDPYIAMKKTQIQNGEACLRWLPRFFSSGINPLLLYFFLFSIISCMIGARMISIEKLILPPGTTSVLARDMNEPGIIFSM